MTAHPAIERERSGWIRDNAGALCELWRPTASEVEALALMLINDECPHWGEQVPAVGVDRWNQWNGGWQVRYLSGQWFDRNGKPSINVAERIFFEGGIKALRILLEAMLARVIYRPDGRAEWFELAACDGATGWPDCWTAGVCCRELAAIAHDYIFALHHARLPDAFGETYALAHANAIFRDILRAQGHHAEAILQHVGVSSWIARRMWDKHDPELARLNLEVPA